MTQIVDERVSDAERSAFAERLASAVGHGTLDISEYDRRVTQVYAATDRAGLSAAVADLPLPKVPHPTPRSRRQIPWGPYLAVNALCVAIWAITCVATLSLVYPWPVWVAGPWGLALILGSITGFPPGARTCMLPPVPRRVRRGRTQR